MSRPEPIIEYAHKIGKNTAEFTVSDLIKFMKWWMKQPPRKDLMEATAAQIATYKADVAKVQKYFKEQKMLKNGQYNNAVRSRLSSNQVVDAEQADEYVVEEMTEVETVEEETPETVCSMELTKADVEALLWAINEVFENYDLSGTAHEKPLKELQDGLSGIE